MVDAYWLSARAAKRRSTDTGGTTSCPNCGKELDEDLDFCHWCSTELAGDDAGDGEELTAGEVNRQSGALDADDTTEPDPDEDVGKE